MTNDLSIFAARLRDFIAICADEFSDAQPDPALAAHADAEFNGLALVLFALQFTHNAPYRKLCDARGVTPDSVHHWSQIPAAPTRAFKDFELSCLPPDERTRIFHSSGTTGQKSSRHFHNAESLGVYEASLWPWFEWNLKPEISNLRLVILTPPPAQAPRSSLVHMFETVRQKLGAPESAFLGRAAEDGSWSLDFDATLSALADNPEREPRNARLILGTAFSFVHLLDYMHARGLHLRLPPGSRVMETGGYKGRSRSVPKPELHELIREHLGVPPSHIVCEYGMSELSSQAYETRNLELGTRNFLFPPWARAQIISPETGREVADGETGLIRVFDLANVLSVMAVQTEDLAVRRADGFELIGRATLAESRGCSLMAV